MINGTIDYNKGYSYGANLMLGFNYVTTKNIVIGIEVLPGYYFSHSTNGEQLVSLGKITQEVTTDVHSYQKIGMDNSAVLFSLLYRLR